MDTREWCGGKKSIPYSYTICLYRILEMEGLPGGTVVKNLPANARDAGDLGLISGSGRPPGRGNGNPLQYSCPGNPMDRGARGATSMWSQRVGHDWASTYIEHTLLCKHHHHLSLEPFHLPKLKLLYPLNNKLHKVPWPEEPGRLQSTGSQSQTWLNEHARM